MMKSSLEFSEFWHNKETFSVHQILDDECNRAKRCKSSKGKSQNHTKTDLTDFFKKRFKLLHFEEKRLPKSAF